MSKFLDKVDLLYLFNKIKLMIHPICSVYISVINTSPAILFGGTWVSCTYNLLHVEKDSLIIYSRGVGKDEKS